MKELNLIQKFDAVLDALYEISGKHPTFRRINALLYARKKKVHWGEVWDIFKKMQKDGLLHDAEPSIAAWRKVNPRMIVAEDIYLITFEGKLMKERGGLKCKIWREKATIRWTNTISILTLFIAGLALYFSLSGVNDSTLKEVNESLQKGLVQQDSLLQLEKNKIEKLQSLQDTLSKKGVSIRLRP